jgi:hypothetical protein
MEKEFKKLPWTHFFLFRELWLKEGKVLYRIPLRTGSFA